MQSFGLSVEFYERMVLIIEGIAITLIALIVLSVCRTIWRRIKKRE